MTIIGLASVMVTLVAAAENCFYNNHMTYIYSLPDYSGNYTSVKEYWLAKETTCDFIQDTNSKLTWYSSDISAKYVLYWDFQDGQGCRTVDPFKEMVNYPHDLAVNMGLQKYHPERTDLPAREEVLCLVKY